jgi:hypothetical protein
VFRFVRAEAKKEEKIFFPNVLCARASNTLTRKMSGLSLFAPRAAASGGQVLSLPLSPTQKPLVSIKAGLMVTEPAGAGRLALRADARKGTLTARRDAGAGGCARGP